MAKFPTSGRREIGDAFVVSQMIIVSNEVGDLASRFPHDLFS
jgi:hypothetical protein